MHSSSRFPHWPWVVAACAVLATASAQLGLASAYALFKPLPLLLLIAAVLLRADRTRHARSTGWLLAALAFSLQGDVWLLLSNGFLPGLLSFWLVHACYIALLRRDTPWRPVSWSVCALVCAAVGTALYAFLWHNGLPQGLHGPVAAYVLVIAAMAAQALARASALGTPAARCVAAGAVLFMLSDTLLAVNKFVQPLAAAELGILGCYYLAQALIVHGMLGALGAPRPQRP